MDGAAKVGNFSFPESESEGICEENGYLGAASRGLLVVSECLPGISPTINRHMKKSIYLVIAAALVAAFAGCSSASIEGSWKLTGVDLTFNGEQVTLGEEDLPPVTLQLLEGGTYKEGRHSGTWDLSGKTLTITTGPGPVEYEVVALTSDQLSIKLTVDDPENGVQGIQITSYVRVEDVAPTPAPAPGPPGEPAPGPGPAPVQ